MIDYDACTRQELIDTLEDCVAELIMSVNPNKDTVTENDVCSYLNDDGLWVDIFKEEDRRWSRPIMKKEDGCTSESAFVEENSMIEKTIESEPFTRKNLYLGINLNLTYEGEPQEDGRYFCICGIVDCGAIVGYTYTFLYYTCECKWETYEGDTLVVLGYAKEDKLGEPTMEDIIHGGTIGE